MGARAGTHNTIESWALHGGKWGSLDTAVYLQAGDTDGIDGIVARDAQTANNIALGSSASLAPGPVNTETESIDGQLELSKNNWIFRAAYKLRDDVGSGAGASQALDPNGENSSKRLTADLTYHDPKFSQNWDVTLQAGYMYYNERSDLFLFPPGTVLGGAFPNGVIGNPYKWERHDRLSASAFYTGFQEHRVRVGAGYEVSDLYKIRETRNYQLTFVPGTGYVPFPLGSIVDVTGTAPFIVPHKRTNKYLYVQDEWGFANDWTLTAGLRHDDYSDFGTTTNPRLALVWEAAYNLTAKLLYGEAFRAPSFSELYNINNPVLQGNPALKAEEIETLEAAISWQPQNDWQVNFNIFRYEMEDIIRAVPNTDPLTGSTTQNTGKQTGKGLEVELTWYATKTIQLQGSYAYQESTDKATGKDAGLAPNHQIYLRGDWRFSPRWSASAQLNWVGDRKREPNDTRSKLGDYLLVDLTIRTNNRSNGWDYSFSVRNIFDEDAREPSPAPGLIPEDLPLPGRSIFAEAIYRFD